LVLGVLTIKNNKSMILTIVIGAVLFGGIPKDCKEDNIRFTEMVLVEETKIPKAEICGYKVTKR
jgi:hypothetical protein